MYSLFYRCPKQTMLQHICSTLQIMDYGLSERETIRASQSLKHSTTFTLTKRFLFHHLKNSQSSLWPSHKSYSLDKMSTLIQFTVA